MRSGLRTNRTARKRPYKVLFFEDKDLVFKVQRLSESPWVSLDRALTNAYADVDSDTVLPEPDEVSDLFRDLKNNVNLAKAASKRFE